VNPESWIPIPAVFLRVLGGEKLFWVTEMPVAKAMILTCSFLLAGAVLSARPAAALSPQWVFEHASPSVAAVYAIDASRKIVGRGSGVFLTKDLLVTNCHVVGRGSTYLVGQAKKRSPARLVAYDADRDLCMLKAEQFAGKAATIANISTLRIGQRVYAIGTPEEFQLTLSEGLISGLRETKSGRYIQTTAPLSEGSSGGGLFDTRGRLIGITSFVFSPGQNLGFAAPAEWASALVKKATAAGDASVELPDVMTRQWQFPAFK
jgi:serine protease Do